ncbi:hypothetical protein [Pseudolactococcus insecticola]|uniref:Hydrophobic protein n=1 Tax=Pseudolactococcus insecticola TaxID=2709158 RepID=A0A6A0B651_9LACT|nr:hypothetical protein [Lactococcus insecticola]GFH39988.1 hydrophobic protein [Lactococcus insecticola]
MTELFWTIFLIWLIVRFIRDVFEFQKVRRFRYLVVPIIFLVLALNTGNASGDFNGLLFFQTVVLSALIGIFQGRFASVRTDKIRGGWSYLIGWLLLFIYQLYLTHDIVLQRELFIEIAKDLSVVYRMINMQNTEPETWLMWLSFGLSQIIYYHIIKRKLETKQ